MNFIFTFLGWLGWNVFELTSTKDEADNANQTFSLKEYASKKWDNWLWTLIVATGLLFVGHAGLGLELVKRFDESLEWSDLYYLCSGFISELVSAAIRKIRGKSLTEK